MNKHRMTSIIILVGFLVLPSVLRAEVIQLAPSDFMPKDPDEGNWYINSDNDYIYAETGGLHRHLYASLRLPHLATLEEVIIYYFDGEDAPNIQVWIDREKMSDGTVTNLAYFISSGSSVTRQEETITSFTYPTVKIKGYRYYIRIFFADANAGNALTLRGIRVRYSGGV